MRFPFAVRRRPPAPPARSRLTVRRAVAALQTSREHLEAVETGCDDLLVRLHAGVPIDADAPRKLVADARAARLALAHADLF